MSYEVNVLSAYVDNKTGLACLTVQANRDGTSHRSQIQWATDFDVDDPKPLLDVHAWIVSMWMSGEKDIVAVDTDARLYVSRKGKRFKKERIPGKSLNYVWGLNATDIFVLGDSGLVLRRKGTQWRNISIPDAGRLFAIHGTSETNLHVIGEQGQCYRRNGKAWTKLNLKTKEDVFGVHVLESGDVWVCGSEGFAALVKGTKVQRLKLPKKDLQAVTAFQGDVYFGAGTSGIYRLKGKRVSHWEKDSPCSSMMSTKRFLCYGGGQMVSRYDGEGTAYNEFE